jgi:ABC-2 type transport system permease protein
MRKALAVLKREYLEVVRKKSFIVMTLIFPFLMGALMFIPTLLMMKGIEGKRVVVVDGTARLRGAFTDKKPAAPPEPPAGRAGKALAERAEKQPGGKAVALTTDYVAATGDVKAAAQPYLERLRENDGARHERLDGVLLIPSDAFTNTDAKLVYYSRAVSDLMTEERLASAVNHGLSRERLAGRGIDGAEADRLLKRLELEGVKVSKSGEEKKGGELTVGDVISSWDRQGFQAKRGIDIAAQAQGVPQDRQLLTLYLPNERVSNMMPGVGMPTQFVVGRDPASEAVVSALAG